MLCHHESHFAMFTALCAKAHISLSPASFLKEERRKREKDDVIFLKCVWLADSGSRLHSLPQFWWEWGQCLEWTNCRINSTNLSRFQADHTIFQLKRKENSSHMQSEANATEAANIILLWGIIKSPNCIKSFFIQAQTLQSPLASLRCGSEQCASPTQGRLNEWRVMAQESEVVIEMWKSKATLSSHHLGCIHGFFDSEESGTPDS